MPVNKALGHVQYPEFSFTPQIPFNAGMDLVSQSLDGIDEGELYTLGEIAAGVAGCTCCYMSQRHKIGAAPLGSGGCDPCDTGGGCGPRYSPEVNALIARTAAVGVYASAPTAPLGASPATVQAGTPEALGNEVLALAKTRLQALNQPRHGALGAAADPLDGDPEKQKWAAEFFALVQLLGPIIAEIIRRRRGA